MSTRTRRIIRRTIFHLIVGLLGFVMVYPLLWMVASSFKERSVIFRESYKLIPDPFTVENYIRGWQGFAGIGFDVFFKNSFYVSIMTTIGQVISSSVIAYGFARIRFRGRNFWFVMMMVSMMLPSQIVMIPQFIQFNALGWVGSYKPLIIPAFLGSGFFVFLIMQFISGVPRELDEAARIDGCSTYSIYFRIILPLTTSALVTTALFSFMWTWDNFFGALLYLNNPRMYTVAIALKNFADPTSSTDWGAIFAMSTLSMLPILVVFLSFQRFLVEGISTTGLKG